MSSLFEQARAAFEEYAAIEATDPRVAKMPTLQRVQIRQAAWQNRNFGYQPPERMVLGLVEEIGEYEEAPGLAEEDDAIGDICIYAAALCTAFRLDLHTIVALPPITVYPCGDPRPVGRIAHAVLKHVQNIRKMTRDQAGAAIVENLRHVLGALETRENLERIATETADRVFLRNWREAPETGGVA